MTKTIAIEMVIKISRASMPEKVIKIKKGSRKIPSILFTKKTTKIYMSVAREIEKTQPTNFSTTNFTR
jgi:hypothetical protein